MSADLRIDISTNDHHVRDEAIDAIDALLSARGEVEWSYTFNPHDARPLTISKGAQA